MPGQLGDGHERASDEMISKRRPGRCQELVRSALT